MVCLGVPMTAAEAEGAEWAVGRDFDKIASVETSREFCS